MKKLKDGDRFIDPYSNQEKNYYNNRAYGECIINKYGGIEHILTDSHGNKHYIDDSGKCHDID